jgi:hypothetical protein
METPPQVLNKEHEGNRRDGSASVALYNDPASSQNRETIEHNTGRIKGVRSSYLTIYRFFLDSMKLFLQLMIRLYRLPYKDFGLRYRSSTYDLYDFLALPCQNHYLEAYIFVFSRDRLWLTVLQSTPKIAGIFFCLKLSES